MRLRDNFLAALVFTPAPRRELLVQLCLRKRLCGVDKNLSVQLGQAPLEPTRRHKKDSMRLFCLRKSMLCVSRGVAQLATASFFKEALLKL